MSRLSAIIWVSGEKPPGGVQLSGKLLRRIRKRCDDAIRFQSWHNEIRALSLTPMLQVNFGTPGSLLNRSRLLPPEQNGLLTETISATKN
jgi:hypothetical protein